MKKPIGASTLSEYFDQIEEPRRSEMRALHRLISKAVPKLKPGIQFGMIGYGTHHYKYASGREGDAPVVALASQKNYISVYACASDGKQYVAERRKAELGRVSVGKSCIRFKRLADVDLRALESVVKEAARMLTASVKARGGTAG
jgi:hypothetical protein